MDFIKKIKQRSGITTNYGLAKYINNLGVKLVIQSLDFYEADGPRRMRLDVLCALRSASGMSWQEFGEMIEAEFFSPVVRKKSATKK